RCVARRNDEARRALEYVQVLGLCGDDRNGLNRRRAGADDADMPAGEVYAVMRPSGSVVGRAAECPGALELRLVRRRETAGRHHAIVCGEARAVYCLDDPAVRGLV